MRNKIALGLSLSLLVFSCAFAEDSLTITTYYPSPYGVYNQLATNRLAVGDTNGSGSLDAADQPNRDGDIRLKAQAGNPTAWPFGTTGQIAYSSANDSLYHYNGSAWVASGGGAGLKIVKDSQPGNYPFIDCGVGWQIVKCGEGGGGSVGDALYLAGLGYGGSIDTSGGKYRPCSGLAYGAQTYSGMYVGCGAVIGLCAKQ